MKKIYLYFTVLATVAAACTKDESDFSKDGYGLGPEVTPEVKMITETISGSAGSSTRVEIGDENNSFSWTVGDNIAVHVSKDNSHEYVFTSGNGGSGASLDAEDPSKATFTVAYQMGYTRDAFAIYPSTIVSQNAANYGQSGSTLDVTLPSSYTLDQLTGTRTPCPMIAVNDASSDTWAFNQLCGLLRLKVSNIPATTKRLEIDFDGKKVWGDFSIAAGVTPGTSVIATTADDNHDIITITKDGTTDAVLGETNMDLNIPLPTGSYSNITVTAYDALTAGTVTFTMTTAFAYSAQQAHGTKITVKVPFPPGEFSVNADGKKVIFAPGNLQYLGNADGTGTWRFAENQYDFMGDGPSSGTNYQGNVTVSGYTKYNASADLDVARDLFGWGTSGYNGKYPWMTTKTTSNYYSGSLTGTDYDWGVYHSASGSSTEKITNGGDYSWRLLTYDEWTYIINRKGNVFTRGVTMDKNLYACATVVGVKGIILFPDNWKGELDKTILYGNESGLIFNGTTCDAEKWAKFEDAGCVFLPAAHARSGTSMDNNNEGRYWTSTVFSVLNNTEFRGGTMEFTNTGAVSVVKIVRRYGQSVRLIRDVVN